MTWIARAVHPAVATTSAAPTDAVAHAAAGAHLGKYVRAVPVAAFALLIVLARSVGPMDAADSAVLVAALGPAATELAPVAIVWASPT